MSQIDDTWQRIAAANRAAGIDRGWSLAERDQMEAAADDLNRELERSPVVHAWCSEVPPEKWTGVMQLAWLP